MRCRSSAPPAAGSSRTIPDEHVEKIGAYVDLGFRHLVFHAPGPDQARFLKLYGEQVLPRLRAPLRAEPDRALELLAAPRPAAGAGRATIWRR